MKMACEDNSKALWANLGAITVPKIFGQEGVSHELSNAVFDKFLFFLKRKLKHFQIVRFFMNFIQNQALLAVH